MSGADPVFQALDWLEQTLGPKVPGKHASYLERVRNERHKDIATVRQRLAEQDTEIQRLREERDAARDAIKTAVEHWPGEAHLGTAYYALTDALPEAADMHESLRLSVERGNERLMRMTARAEAAEAENRRLTEGLREIHREATQHHQWWSQEKARALLAGSEAEPDEGGEA